MVENDRTSTVCHLRSYNVRENNDMNLRIWEASRATTAMRSFFQRISIEDATTGLEYPYYISDLGYIHSNPT